LAKGEQTARRRKGDIARRAKTRCQEGERRAAKETDDNTGQDGGREREGGRDRDTVALLLSPPDSAEVTAPVV